MTSDYDSICRSVVTMDIFKTTASSSKDECDQNDDFTTQLLIIAGVAVVIGLTMCLAGKLHR